MTWLGALRSRWTLLSDVARGADPSDGRRWRLAARGAMAALVLAVLADAWLFSCGFRGCPSAATIRTYRPPEGGRIVDRNGRLLGRLTPVKRINVPLQRIPRHVQQAFLATEDRRFYLHEGVDWRGFARALSANVRAREVRQGFSTISMQVARNAFMSERQALRRSFGRKVIELRIARLLERELSKQQILALYLNSIYLGNGVYGVDAASRDLFGKRVEQLTLAEGATLAALPKGPSWYTPKRHPERTVARRNLVLQLMARDSVIDADQLAAAVEAPLEVASEDWRPAQPGESYALDLVRAYADSVIGRRKVHGDLVVYTTLDLAAQRAAERAVRVTAARVGRDGDGYGEGDVQGAMVALDPRTGDIRALVGGRRYERGGFNRAIAARRQPGSAFKPFVYAAAMGAGLTPASVVDDDPIAIDLGDATWRPANYGDEYRGPLTLRHALAHSANAATVRVSRAVGEARVLDVARRAGIQSSMQPVPAIALGAVSVTPLELVTAYAPFANGGSRVRPRLVTRIEGPTGAVLVATAATREPGLDPRDAFQVTSMLRSVVDEGTGRAVRDLGVTGAVAGKTGTTNDGADIWFVGFTPTVVAGFWFGYDTPRPLGDGVNGGRYAAPAWAEFYRTGWRERATPWRAPDGLVPVEIDAETGLLASEWCPATRREWFRSGTEPTGRCDHHSHGGFLGDLWEELEDVDIRPLTRALRRLIER